MVCICIYRIKEWTVVFGHDVLTNVIQHLYKLEHFTDRIAFSMMTNMLQQTFAPSVITYMYIRFIGCCEY